MALDDLDFQDRALELLLLLQLVLEVCLAQIGYEGDQVGETLTGDGRGGAQGHVGLRVIVLPIEAGIDALLSEGKDGLVQAVLELVLGRGILGVKGVTHVVEGLCLPLIDSINLV